MKLLKNILVNLAFHLIITEDIPPLPNYYFVIKFVAHPNYKNLF